MTANHFSAPSFTALAKKIERRFVTDAVKVPPSYWQGENVANNPAALSYELANVSFSLDVRHQVDDLNIAREDIDPNLPWADDHFEERVCGYPINPGVEWRNWPWAASADKFRDGGMFNHNYMERYWPKFAGKYGAAERPSDYIGVPVTDDNSTPNRGIRWQYGDLSDVVNLLQKDPLTRQAWLPIFFPEDTGIGDGGRKPCTLGYQFIRRGQVMSIYYPLRSCDFIRHFRDDAYLAVRLLEWMIGELQSLSPEEWQDVRAGDLSMHCTSLHVFANDAIKMGIPR